MNDQKIWPKRSLMTPTSKNSRLRLFNVISSLGKFWLCTGLIAIETVLGSASFAQSLCDQTVDIEAVTKTDARSKVGFECSTTPKTYYLVQHRSGAGGSDSVSSSSITTSQHLCSGYYGYVSYFEQSYGDTTIIDPTLTPERSVRRGCGTPALTTFVSGYYAKGAITNYCTGDDDGDGATSYTYDSLKDQEYRIQSPDSVLPDDEHRLWDWTVNHADDKRGVEGFFNVTYSYKGDSGACPSLGTDDRYNSSYSWHLPGDNSITLTHTAEYHEYGGTWYTQEYTTKQLESEVEGLVAGLFAEDSNPRFSSGGACSAKTISAGEVCAIEQRSKWRLKILHPIPKQKYLITWTMRLTHPGNPGWVETKPDNSAEWTAPDSSDDAYYPSAAGTDLEVKNWPKGDAFADRTEMVEIIEARAVPIDSDSPPAPPGAGGPSGGPSGSCATCSGSSGGPSVPGVHLSISMGPSLLGGSAGEIYLDSTEFSDGLAKPAALRFSGSSADVIGNPISEIHTPQATAKIVPDSNNTNRYRIIISNPSETSVITTWTIEKISGLNRLQITETPAVGDQRVWLYTEDDGIWTINMPDLSEHRVSRTVDSNGDYTDWTQIAAPGGAVVVLEKSQVYKKYGWGYGLVSDTVGAGNAARSTTYTYYTTASEAGYTPSSAHPPIATIVRPDGSWENYLSYDPTGRSLQVLSGIDGSVSSFPNACMSIEYSYNPVDSSDNGLSYPNSPRTVTQKFKGVVTSVTYHIYTADSHKEIRCSSPTAAYNDPNNLVTETTYFKAGEDNAGRVKSISYPDGTMTFYNYVVALDGKSKTVTQWTGVPDSGRTSIVDGIIDERVTGEYGEIISIRKYNIAPQITIASEDYAYPPELNPDGNKRSYIVTYLDKTMATYWYGCCGLKSVIDRDGVTTEYFYDALKRQTAWKRNGITVTNILDAAGRTLRTERVGTNNIPMVLSQSEYDTAGRITASTNALYGRTKYTEVTDASGFTRTTENPDTGTLQQFYFPNGALKKVTGTASHPVRYEQGTVADGGINATYSREIKLDDNGNDTAETVTTYRDMLGRRYKTVYAGITPATSQFFFNSKGQQWKTIDPDGVVTLYVYNALGEVQYTIQAVDDNTRALQATSLTSLPALTSSDRVTETKKEYVHDSATGLDLLRVKTLLWDEDKTSGTTVSCTETSCDGLKSWQTVFGVKDEGNPVTSSSFTEVDAAHGSRVVTITAADSSRSVNTYSFGRLASVEKKASANGAVITSTVYGYDAHGRQDTVADLRNGTTIYTFTNSDQIVSITTPSPVDGASPEVTRFYYDNMGRVKWTQLPDNTWTTNAYTLKGELQSVSGSRTYPVTYTYDPQGRMQTMTTWTNYAGNSGRAVTTWEYDPYRGFLAKKIYDGATRSPSYSYTDAGRLKNRVSASGTNTIYSYTWGDLTGIEYNGTLAISNTYDRRGRLKTVQELSAEPTRKRTTTLNYNNVGQVETEVHTGGLLDGVTVTSVYGDLLRRTSTSIAGMESSYTYTGSRLHTVTQKSLLNGWTPVSATYEYVNNSPLVETITVSSASQLGTIVTTKQYDRLNRSTDINTTVGSGVAGKSSYHYNLAGQRDRATEADQSYWVYEYDKLGQVHSGCKYWADGTPVAGQHFIYDYDDIGNRTSTQSGGDQTGGGLRPIAGYRANGVNKWNQYDDRDVPGFVDIMGLANASATVTVNDQSSYRKSEYFRKELPVDNSRLSVYFGITNLGVLKTADYLAVVASNTGNIYVPAATERFSYDDDGNLKSDGRWNYTWDAENRLLCMTPRTAVGPQQTINFEYDYQGRRIRKQVTESGLTVVDQRFVHDGWNLIATLNSSSAITAAYTWGIDLSGSMQGAGGVGGLLFASVPGSQNYVAYDGNGNVSMLINKASGQLTAQYEYGPFGEVIRATGPMAKANPFRFSTKYTDDESDLVYYGYRYYNPSTGRWLSRDPLGEMGGLNLYGFVGNRPISSVDVNGDWPWSGGDSDVTELPDGSLYSPPLPRPPGSTPPTGPTGSEPEDNIDSNLTWGGAKTGDILQFCKTFQRTAYTALEFTPQNAFSEAAFGETLGQEKVGVGRRVIAVGAVIPSEWALTKVVGKAYTFCCDKVTICLFVQRHHLIPKARFAEHKLIKLAGVDIKSDPNNLMDLLNHSGDHTEEYYLTVQRLMDEAYAEVKAGRISAGDAYQGVCKTVREGVTDGSINPYLSKDVYPTP